MMPLAARVVTKGSPIVFRISINPSQASLGIAGGGSGKATDFDRDFFSRALSKEPLGSLIPLFPSSFVVRSLSDRCPIGCPVGCPASFGFS